jgi:hypothetical protein
MSETSAREGNALSGAVVEHLSRPNHRYMGSFTQKKLLYFASGSCSLVPVLTPQYTCVLIARHSPLLYRYFIIFPRKLPREGCSGLVLFSLSYCVPAAACKQSRAFFIRSKPSTHIAASFDGRSAFLPPSRSPSKSRRFAASHSWLRPVRRAIQVRHPFRLKRPQPCNHYCLQVARLLRRANRGASPILVTLECRVLP